MIVPELCINAYIRFLFDIHGLTKVSSRMFKCNHNHRLSGGATCTLNSSIAAYSMNLFAIHAPMGG